MKKSLSTILSLAMAFSMFSSVAMAADAAKTSADFSDLKDLDAATKAKFDAMISAGIFDGVKEGTFGVKDEMNRAQFAKVAALIAGLKVDTTLKASSFTDVKSDDPANGYALPYIEAAKAAGITDGYAPGEYNPAGKVTKEQLATFLVRILGKDATAKATPGVNDSTVSDWAKGYVATAISLKLLSNGADGKFGGTSNATRDLLVLGAYEAKQQYKVSFNGKYAIASLKATDANVLQLTLNGALTADAEKALKIAVKRDGSVVDSGYTVKWDDKKTVATLTFDGKFQDNKYDVTIGGVSNLDDTAKTASVTTTIEKISKIEFLTASDTIPLMVWKDAGSTIYTGHKVRVDFKATNQYGAQSKLSASNFSIRTSDGTVTPIAGEQAFFLKEDDKAQRDDRISINILHEDSGVNINKVFAVGDRSLVSKVEVGDLLNAAGNKVDGVEAGGSAYLDLKAYDQYGFKVEDKAQLNDDITVSTTDSDMKIGNEDKDAFVDTVVGTDAADLRLYVTGSEEKNVTVSIFARGGNSATKQVKIVASKMPATIEFGSYNYTLAENDKTTNDEEVDRKFYLPLIVKDSKGDQLTPQEVVDAYNADKFRIDTTSGIDLQTAEISNSGSFRGMIAIKEVGRKGSQSVTVRLKDKYEVKATANIYVGDPREAQEIRETLGLKKYMVTGADNEVKYKFFDQQGSEMKFDTNADDNYFVKLSYTVNSATGTGMDLSKLYLGSKELTAPAAGNNKIKLSTTVVGNTYDEYFKVMDPAAANAPGVNYWDNWFDKSFKIYSADSKVQEATVTVKATLYKADKSVANAASFKALTADKYSEVDSTSSTVEVVDANKSENKLTYEAYFDKQSGNNLLAIKDFLDLNDSYIQGGSTVTDGTYIYNQYKKATGEIKIRAKKNGGEEVKVGGTVVSVTSSNRNIVDVQDTKFAVGKQAGTATLNVIFVNGKGEQQTATMNVTTKNEAPQVQSLVLKKTGKDLTDRTVFNNGLYLWDKALAEKITVKDQYNDEFVGEFGYGVFNEEQKLADQNLIAIKNPAGTVQSNADNNNDLLNLSFYISDVVGGSASEFSAADLATGLIKFNAGQGTTIKSFKVNVNSTNGKAASFDVTLP